MKRQVRLVIYSLSIPVAVIALSFIALPIMGSSSLSAHEAYSICQTWWEQNIRDNALTTRDRAVQQSMEGKQAVIFDLIEGKITMETAIGCFMKLQRLLDDGQDDILGTYNGAGSTEREMKANVICWVHAYLRNHPDISPEKLARIEKNILGERYLPNNAAY